MPVAATRQPGRGWPAGSRRRARRSREKGIPKKRSNSCASRSSRQLGSSGPPRCRGCRRHERRGPSAAAARAPGPSPGDTAWFATPAHLLDVDRLAVAELSLELDQRVVRLALLGILRTFLVIVGRHAESTVATSDSCLPAPSGTNGGGSDFAPSAHGRSIDLLGHRLPPGPRRSRAGAPPACSAAPTRAQGVGVAPRITRRARHGPSTAAAASPPSRRRGVASSRSNQRTRVALLRVHAQRLGAIGHHEEPNVQVQVRRLGSAARDGVHVHVDRPGRFGWGTTGHPVSSVASRSAVARRSSPSTGSTCPPGWSHRPSFRWCTSATRLPSVTTALPVKCALG